MFRFLFLLIWPFLFGAAGDSVRKVLPLDRPVSLSGNYGELRDGRFHAGLDFRVGGSVGERIHSIDTGYVWRASVSPSGYGNGLYIKHPDGTVSIYGHMLDFAPEIAQRVKEKQYETKRFSVNLYFRPDEFPVSAHQFIGRVGNTGSSAAPHLHLEVRDSSESGPLNVLSSGFFEIADDVPPIIQCVNFYSYEDSTGVPVTSLAGSFKYPVGHVISLGEKSYAAIDAVDKQYGTVAKLAVEKYEVFLDGESIYSYKVGDYTYAEQDCFNSLIDYGEKYRSGSTMIKTYVEPGNGFYPSKISCKNNGLIVLRDNEIHEIKILVEDLSGNKAVRKFKVVRRQEPRGEHVVPEDCAKHTFRSFQPWFAPMAYVAEGFIVSLPVAPLFRSIYFTVDKISAGVWKIGEPDIAIKKGGSIAIAADLPDSLRSKAFIASISEDGQLHYCGGRWSDGMVRGRFSAFGTYCVAVDTVAPVIVPRGRAVFTIKDEMSGIKTYNAYIDGKWVVAAYDQKYDKLSIQLDNEVIVRGKEHVVEVVATDAKENETTWRGTFKW